MSFCGANITKTCPCKIFSSCENRKFHQKSFDIFNIIAQNIDHGRRNISIGIRLNLFISTEMGYIQPLVENENSAKLQNCVILT